MKTKMVVLAVVLVATLTAVSHSTAAAPNTPIGFWITSTDTENFWNSRAMWSSDLSPAWTGSSSLLAGVTVGTKSISYSDPSVGGQVMQAAAASGIPTVLFNYEITDTVALAQAAQQQWSLAQSYHLRFIWCPLGSMLANNYLALAPYGDVVLYQTQYLQAKPGYSTTVLTNLANIRSVRAGGPVLAHVSVNPPADPTRTAKQVIQDINSLLGDPRRPNGVTVWYQAGNTDRIQVMEQVVDYYRPAK